MGAKGIAALVVLLIELWAVYDIIRRPVSATSKIGWLALVLLFPLVGVVIYFAVGTSSLDKRA